ncbi:N-terminal acetyltransferase B complex auxiliary subunit NAA25-like isoform X1 [Actinidia eriantha]|uniref:N-terminal acetyltransferase B complex auxiliary subunit NAA25-like isoform X1 n=1 Tax=Actinidia eriantha TaxID=165200 RepID=UPI00258B4417|nr:N-terminal acetyltransferase B complex auxiliary subunit NAA25-like isoform X1 [Actinidia eriantha]
MASKFGMAGGIPERRVRPIWDAIDSRQFKNALKLSASLLAKYPNSPYALALKALILERMGKPDDALSVCLNAKELLHTNDSILIDDLTLSTLQIVFQRLDHLDMATSCYEYACGKFPNNLELMMGLFNCYVREYSFVKQQQIAIKMYKVGGEERFLLWAVCSIQLQVLCGNGGEKLLLLAEGLLKKHITSHSLHEPEALIVYISLLEQQSKFGDALEILSGKLGSLVMIEVDRLRIQGKLLARAGDYAAAADIFRKVLELCPDDWECFLHYLGCMLEDDSSWCDSASCDPVHPSKSVDCKLSHLTDEVFGSRISNVSAFVEKWLASSSNDTVRCPYLANLEIERRKFLFGEGNDDKLIEALMLYFFRFGHLTCFASDVEGFLHVLVHDKRTLFVEKLMDTFESPATMATKALGKSLSIFKIQEIVGNFFTLPASDLEGLAVQMTEMYCKNLPLSKDLDLQESMHGEDLLSMASSILVQLFWRTKHLGYLVESVMVLEFGLTIRRYVWQYKILLLHLYSHWGALSLAYQWYKTLDVKNILLETVSHQIVPQMLISPLWVDLGELLRDYLKFMDDHFRESADLTFLAYRHRNYSKVIEFVQFKERLQRSSQYLMAKIEAPILLIKQNADNIEEEESVLESLKCGVHFLELSSEIGSKSLTFNEDLQSRPWWTPTYDKNYLLGPFEGVSYCPRESKQNQIKQAEANVPKAIERRSLLPRMIYLSIQCASSSLKENVETNGSVFDPKISLELKILLERYAKFLGFPFQNAVEMLFATSSGRKSSEALSSDLIDWMNFAVFLNAWNLNSNEIGVDKNACRTGTWHLVNSLLEKYILENLRSMGPIISSPGCNLPLLVQLVAEPLAWHALVIQSCVRSSLPSGKKKKKGGPAEQTHSQLSQGIRDSIQSLCAVIEEVENWLREQINSPEDVNMEIILSSLRVKDQKEGPGKVFQILETSISSMHNVEIGDRISQALKSWSSADVARKIVTGQRTVLSEFLRICESKVKSLQGLKLQI